MLPDRLTAASFASYPPEARSLATRELATLQRLPLAFAPLLLRELIVYDWKFPPERADLDRQFAYLRSLAPAALKAAVASFAELKLTPALEAVDWVNSPAAFSEELSAHLWATHQIDAFTRAAVDYVDRANASAPDPPLPTHRLTIAIVGQGVTQGQYRLFRKLRPRGIYYTRVKCEGGAGALLAIAGERAAKHPAPYAHWHIDGGAAEGKPLSLVRVSYAALSSQRAALQNRMQKTYEAAVFDPEAFRSMLARLTPEDAGFEGGDETLNRFQLSLLTEGSGTQVFATTFVQWAARETLRRAQPLTLIVRFTPRQREKQMNELLAENQRPPDPDPEGSLIDADQGAYYTWLNQQRLSGAEKAAFVAWFEDRSEAIVVAPGFAAGKRSDDAVDLVSLVRSLA